MKQLGLFAEPASEPDFSEERALASRLPAHVRFGTSSWTYTGWSGICFPPKTSEKTLLERGLELYARYPLFGTVGIDRSYYAPIPEAELSRYASQLPPRFPAVMKVWNAITTKADARTGEPIATYLDPSVFERAVLAPLRAAFRENVGVLVFEHPPFRGPRKPSVEEFADELDGFFARVPRDVPYAVEIRNRELLAKPYLDALARHGVAHVLNFWEEMPDIGAQLARPGVLGAEHVVARLMIRPGTRYAERKAQLTPFDRVRDRNESLREDVRKLVERCAALGKELFLIVGNKAEGSAPLTVRALAERIARAAPVMDAPPRPC